MSPEHAPSILSGPPAFILLATLFGLAVYLRQVSLSAHEHIEEIETDRKPESYPRLIEGRPAPHTEAMLQHLRSTRSKLRWVTLVVFGLILFLSVRIFWYALLVAYPCDPPSFLNWLYIIDERLYQVDLWFAAILILFVGSMFLMHWLARRRSDQIHEQMLRWRAGVRQK